jgi:molybdopterin-containing oxidoreductase family iron-sulfur binding subunit
MPKCSDRKNLAASPAIAGIKQWRTLDELAQTEGFAKLLHDEFPHAASVWPDGHSRRNFLKLMGASLALAGLSTSCTRKADEKIVPFVRQPEEMVPGNALYFATAAVLAGYAKGILVTSYDGRPIKIEGNPDHPANPRRQSAATAYGASDALTQGEILNMYDPNRSANVLKMGQVSDYNAFTKTIADNLGDHPQGQGISLLTEATSSPTLLDQITRFQAKYPQARVYAYEPLWPQNSRQAVVAAFGQPLEPIYKLDKAKVIVSLDSDFLIDGAANLVYAAQFIDGRRVRAGNAAMNQLFVAETTTTPTGALADVRVRLRPSELDKLASALAGVVGGDAGATTGLSDKQTAWVKAAAAALAANKGTSIVLPGEPLSPAAQIVVHKLNENLGNIGSTVQFIDAVVPQPMPDGSTPTKPGTLDALVTEMKAGNVGTLILLGGNPVFTAPADLDFAGALDRVELRVHLGQYYNETAFRCHWHIPQSHDLESWGDARAFDGTAGLLQPLILPLHPSRSAIELMGILLAEYDREAHSVVQDYWRRTRGGNDFDAWWQKSLNDGVIADSAFTPRSPQVGQNGPAPAAAAAAGTYDIVFRADPTIYDGRFATNGWLQELPKPITKLTWDNAALMSSATAAALGVVTQDQVKLTANNQSVTAPVFIVPGHPDNTITAHLGYGRKRPWMVGDAEEPLMACGFNVYPLRTSTTLNWAPATVEKVPGTYQLASTQWTQLMEGRAPIHVLHADDSASAFAEPGEAPEAPVGDEPGQRTVPLSLYPEVDYSQEPNKWGMIIDQNACIGCNACMIACQAENNSPVVGKEQVALGRHMHWIRIDAYYAGDNDADPAGPFFQPLPCMQCEKAPCEVVCPVNATVHDAEGINNQVYNRCVGTRYCANNCPYKVRRFNFFEYANMTNDLLKLSRNPDVTVRSRGIMEKCNYCLQRISRGRIEAKKQFRNIRDGEVLTACQQACPTTAIIFGNLNDRQSVLSQVVKEPQNYSLLAELQTIPRTTYLPRYTNEIKGLAPFERTFEQQAGEG